MFDPQHCQKLNKTMQTALTLELEVELAVKHLSDLRDTQGSAPSTEKTNEQAKTCRVPVGQEKLPSALLGREPQCANFRAQDPVLHHFNLVGSQLPFSHAGIPLLLCWVHIQD